MTRNQRSTSPQTSHHACGVQYVTTIFLRSAIGNQLTPLRTRSPVASATFRRSSRSSSITFSSIDAVPLVPACKRSSSNSAAGSKSLSAASCRYIIANTKHAMVSSKVTTKTHYGFGELKKLSNNKPFPMLLSKLLPNIRNTTRQFQHETQCITHTSPDNSLPVTKLFLSNNPFKHRRMTTEASITLHDPKSKVHVPPNQSPRLWCAVRHDYLPQIRHWQPIDASTHPLTCC